MAQTGAEIKDNEVSRKKSNATQRTCLTKETLEQPLGIMTVFETFNFKYIIYLLLSRIIGQTTYPQRFG